MVASPLVDIEETSSIDRKMPKPEMISNPTEVSFGSTSAKCLQSEKNDCCLPEGGEIFLLMETYD